MPRTSIMQKRTHKRRANITRHTSRVLPMLSSSMHNNHSTMLPPRNSMHRPRRRTQRHRLSQDDLAGKLQQLAELHNTGVLSDEEFAAAKENSWQVNPDEECHLCFGLRSDIVFRGSLLPPPPL